MGRFSCRDNLLSIRLHPLQKVAEIHGADSPGDLFSVLEDEGGGNALNSELLGDQRLRFRIDFGEAKTWF